MSGCMSATCDSNSICRRSATRASLSKRSASAALPDWRTLSAFWLAARALPPHSAAASPASRASSSISRRLPMVWAMAASASRMLAV